jgi:hypothetical protein
MNYSEPQSESLPNLYVDIEQLSAGFLAEEDVRLRLQNMGYVIGELPEHIGILDSRLRKVVYKETASIFLENTPTKLELGEVVLVNDQAIVVVNRVVDTYQLRHNALSNRVKRDKLLESTDWVEVSTAVTPSTKTSYVAYRQLLRDIFTVCEDTGFINLPIAPEIVMKTSSKTIINKKQIEALQKYSPKDSSRWLVFLKEWEKLQFTDNKDLINNLLLAYVGISYVNLVKEMNNG